MCEISYLSTSRCPAALLPAPNRRRRRRRAPLGSPPPPPDLVAAPLLSSRIHASPNIRLSFPFQRQTINCSQLLIVVQGFFSDDSVFRLLRVRARALSFSVPVVSLCYSFVLFRTIEASMSDLCSLCLFDNLVFIQIACSRSLSLACSFVFVCRYIWTRSYASN